MTTKPTTDMNAIAIEALNLWQEHLATLATDPKAKADLARMMEPSRQMFAEWAEKMQAMAHAPAASPFTATPAPVSPSGAEAVRASSDDGAVRISQLALRVAELEERVAKLESRKQRSAGKTRGAAAKPE